MDHDASSHRDYSPIVRPEKKGHRRVVIVVVGVVLAVPNRIFFYYQGLMLALESAWIAKSFSLHQSATVKGMGWFNVCL